MHLVLYYRTEINDILHMMVDEGKKKREKITKNKD